MKVVEKLVNIPYNISEDHYNIKYFTMADGKRPVIDFLADIKDIKLKTKIYKNIELLESWGINLVEPYSKYIEEGIYELRTVFSNNHGRILYFFHHDKTIILTNGFIKKTNKINKKELQLAKKYKKIYLERKG